MAAVTPGIYALNGGEVGDEALARLDLERMQFAGSLYLNMMPRVIGSMTFRPGFENIAALDIGDCYPLEYSYAGGSSLIPILSDNEMRVIKDGVFVTRELVSTFVNHGDFGTFTGWTDDSTGTASADVGPSERLRLFGTTQDTAAASQTLVVSVGDRGTEHALRVDVHRGPVTIRLGSTSGTANLIKAIDLQDGVHSIAFTPTTAHIYLEISNSYARQASVNSCEIERPGVMVLPTPWTMEDLNDNIIRYTQHKDVLYVASSVYQQREIQRRGDTSWGIQRFKADDGPFVTSDGSISLRPNRYVDNGAATLTASRKFFEESMIGRLFRIYQSGQVVRETFASDPAEGEYVRISGVGDARIIRYTVSGTWAGLVRLQVSVDDGAGNPTGWSDVKTRSSNIADVEYEDEDDNVIKYFRFALEVGDLTSGTVITEISYEGGSQFGVARMISYDSPTVAPVEFLSRFYSIDASFEWDYSVWSDFDGWPSSVEKFGGRLYWGLGDFVYGSVPDNYKSYDDSVEGDSAPIARSIGTNTDRGILWLLGMQRLTAGTDASEVSIKASNFDEPLTAGSWFPVESSTRGCLNIRSVKCDTDGIFVQSSGTGIFSLTTAQGSLDYQSSDLTQMHEKICGGSQIIDIAVQRRPDTVIWFILANGEARALTYEPAESVVAWARVVTDGLIKRVCASRGAGQDNVHFVVVRDGVQRLERLADLSDCRGGALNCLADSFVRFDVTSALTDFPVPHLAGKDVTVWVNGVALFDQDNLYTVPNGELDYTGELMLGLDELTLGGEQLLLSEDMGPLGPQVTIPVVASGSVVIGLPYNGDFQSTKLAYGAQNGTALFQRKKVSALGLYLVDTSPDKIRAGKSFDTMHKFTQTNNGRPLTSGQVLSEYDADMSAVSSDWWTDSRVCIRARSPYPATVAAMALDIRTAG